MRSALQRLFLVCGLVGVAHSGSAAEPLPAAQLRYQLHVRIKPEQRALHGQETITWTNRSSLLVDQVPLHLYLNAFAHEGSSWMREAQRSMTPWQAERLLREKPDRWGYLEPLKIEQLVEGQARAVGWRPTQPDDGNVLDRTLISARLARPVAPGETLALRIAFAGRLPLPIARTGCVEGFCLVAQWFPKLGVLEPSGVRGAQTPRWAARQFHAVTEFYADFADYDVTIETPLGWTVGATGRLEESKDKAAGYREVRYVQRAVHDFAIVLGQGLYDAVLPYRPKGNDHPVRIRYLLPMNTVHQLARAQRVVEGTLDFLGEHVGPYPYETLTIVLPPYAAQRTGGMEYPTLICGNAGDPLWESSLLARAAFVEGTLVHEFIHQYFYGLLASNEQEEAFLDEGFTTYWTTRAMEALFGQAASGGWLLGRAIEDREMTSFVLAQVRRLVHEPLAKRPSALLLPGTEFQQIYHRAALTLLTAQGLFGESLVDRVFAAYYQRFRFQHPGTEDFLGVAEQVGGSALAAYVREALLQPALPDYRVSLLEGAVYDGPLGRLTDEKGTLTVTEGSRHQARERFLDPRWREGGKVWVQITDPGWTRAEQHVDGTMSWRAFVAPGARPPQRGAELYESQVRIKGPGWERLPVEVVLRFEDGVTLRERWDGQAAWRDYHMIRPARLAAVYIDPARQVSLDVLPQNNSRTREANYRFAVDWSAWLGALVSWLAEGLSQWL